MYSEVEKTAIRESVPHINALLTELGYEKDTFSQGYTAALERCLDATPSGRIIRRKFSETLFILTLPHIRDMENNILRIFCFVDASGHFLFLEHRFLSPEQVKLIKKSA